MKKIWKKIRTNNLTEMDYTFTSFIVLILFFINSGLYISFEKNYIYVFYILTWVDYILARGRFNNIYRKKSASLMPHLFLFMPAIMIFIFDNKKTFKVSVAYLIFLLIIKISLMFVKEGRGKRTKKSTKFKSEISSGLIVLSVLVNIYVVNYYNQKQNIIWSSRVSGGISSKMIVENKTITFLANDWFLSKNLLNLPRTYILSKKNGETIDKKSGYSFSEGFKMYEDIPKELLKNDIQFYVIEDTLYGEDKTGKVIFKYIAKGKIISTPIIENYKIYIAVNTTSFWDRMRFTSIYAIKY
ncbi:MAG: hypothetical protein KAH04_03775 [Psychrilyobacter sp.]|nr:hypothetical protein [Psychrilyobacter sp.]